MGDSGSLTAPTRQFNAGTCPILAGSTGPEVARNEWTWFRGAGAGSLPEHPGGSAGDGQLDGWSALYSEAADEREAFEQRLRLCWENEDDYDPLLAGIAAARDATLAAEARMRGLIAYGREVTRPRPYKLATL